MIGSIIGTGVFFKAAIMSQQVGSPALVLAAWLVAGLLSLAGALTYAEMKAIASGNSAVMEKVKVDSEIRRLDQLRAGHVNQQHHIRWQIRSLPLEIADAKQALARINSDIGTRDAHGDEEFSMTIGTRVFIGKGARGSSQSLECCRVVVAR